jgi:hypothetical protein
MAKAFLQVTLAESGRPAFLSVGDVVSVCISGGTLQITMSTGDYYYVGCGGVEPGAAAQALADKITDLARDMADTP